MEFTADSDSMFADLIQSSEKRSDAATVVPEECDLVPSSPPANTVSCGATESQVEEQASNCK